LPYSPETKKRSKIFLPDAVPDADLTDFQAWQTDHLSVAGEQVPGFPKWRI